MTRKRQVFLILVLAFIAVGRPFQNASAISIEQGSRRTANVERPAVYVARVLSVSAKGAESGLALAGGARARSRPSPAVRCRARR